MIRRIAVLFAGFVLVGSVVAQVPNPYEAIPVGRPVFSLTLPLNKARWQSKEGRFSRRAALEMGAVALTGAGHLAFSTMDASNVYIPMVVAGWGGYVYHRARTDSDFLARAGFTRAGLGGAFRDASFIAAGSLALMAGIGAAQGAQMLDRDMIPLLLLYPGWGLVQQFLVQGLVAANLADTPGWTGSPYFVTPVTAVVFGSVHFPSVRLAAGTFGLGLAFTPIYLKHRNLWPLGLYHGWLGVFYYFWVLERNPWQSVVKG